MRTISTKQTESALFNLDSLRTSLLNQSYEAYEKGDYIKGEQLDEKVDEVETLLGKMHFGRVTVKEWNRIQELVNERKMQRYLTCVNSGMNEQLASGAFED